MNSKCVYVVVLANISSTALALMLSLFVQTEYRNQTLAVCNLYYKPVLLGLEKMAYGVCYLDTDEALALCRLRTRMF